jgi:hypothetical protein
MDCSVCKKTITDFIPEEPGQPLPKSLQDHLSQCTDCMDYYHETNRIMQKIKPHSRIPTNDLSKRRVLSSIENVSGRDSRQFKNWCTNWGILKPSFAVLAVVIILLFSLFDITDFFTNSWSNQFSKFAGFRVLQAFAADLSRYPNRNSIYSVHQYEVYPLPEFNWVEKQWFPICAINRLGNIETYKVQMKPLTKEKKVFVDECWYDYESKRFLRVISVDEKRVFINAFDGKNILVTTFDDSESVSVQSNPLPDSYTLPKPEMFSGFAVTVLPLLQETKRVVYVNAGEHQDTNENRFRLIKSTLNKTDGLTYFFYFHIDYWLNRISHFSFSIYTHPLFSYKVNDFYATHPFPAPSEWPLELQSEELPYQLNFDRIDVSPFFHIVSVNHQESPKTQEHFSLIEPIADGTPYTMVEFIDPGEPSKKMKAAIVNKKDNPWIFLQSFSIDHMYEEKIKSLSQSFFIDNRKARIWHGSLLNALAYQVFHLGQLFSDEIYPNTAYGYFIEPTPGKYLVLATIQPLQKDELKNILHDFDRNSTERSVEAF